MEAASVAVRRAAALAREKLDADFVVVKLDRTNAFNVLDRAYMLRAIERRVPAAMAYAVAAYARPSHLLFGDAVVSSQQGGQQGDPFMPLAYALAEAQIMEESGVSALHIWTTSRWLDPGQTCARLSIVPLHKRFWATSPQTLFQRIASERLPFGKLHKPEARHGSPLVLPHTSLTMPARSLHNLVNFFRFVWRKCQASPPT